MAYFLAAQRQIVMITWMTTTPEGQQFVESTMKETATIMAMARRAVGMGDNPWEALNGTPWPA